MSAPVQERLGTVHSRDDLARQGFISALREHVLVNMAASMRAEYEAKVEPELVKTLGRAPQTQDEVHDAMRHDPYFKFYSAIRYNAQEMVWRSVTPGVEAAAARLEAAVTAPGPGRLTLRPDLKTPKNVDGIEVHLMPGGYVGSGAPTAGAVYDNGLEVFSAGFMGKDLDDIGMSFANYVRFKFPDFQPSAILDVGCTIGHNTLPWKKTFPFASVTGCDVSAGLVKYAHARAKALGLEATFAQGNATALDAEDASVDVVFNSMFLHELSLKDIRAFIAEARRVLKPGGLFLTMELPPNQELKPYDQFYLDWDCYYNREPFYRAFRDQSPFALMTGAGFGDEDVFQFTVPQYTMTDEATFKDAVVHPPEIGGDTGRLSDTVHWFGFGAWKR